ncbi:hypothetical protein HYY72_01480 [Candidatus Woesearchaeota archaeon]|nr:hypothetical protein [Candidatus Woesearchaeota archaeon]
MTPTEGKKVDEEELQKKYLELQLMGKQIKSSQAQIEALDEQLEAMEQLLIYLDEFKRVKPGSEMLSAISEGIFVKSTLQSNAELVVNVGSDVAVTKTPDEAQELIRARIGQGQRHRTRLVEDFEGMVMLARESEKELSSMVE